MVKALKYILIGTVLIVLIIGVVVVYRMFFQFDHKEISEYAKEESKKYKDEKGAYEIIMEGVQHILSSHNLTMQVLRVAKNSGIDVEQELVHASINQCKEFKYL